MEIKIDCLMCTAITDAFSFYKIVQGKEDMGPVLESKTPDGQPAYQPLGSFATVQFVDGILGRIISMPHIHVMLNN